MLGEEIMLPLVFQPNIMAQTASCIVHGAKCPVKPAGPKITVHCAGFPCVSWSPQGSRQKTSGSDFKHWCAWISHRRHCRDRRVGCLLDFCVAVTL